MTGLDCPILLVGCGKMGGALRSGWLEAGRSVLVVEPGPHAPEGAVPSPEALPADLTPAAVVFAVKPQEAAKILAAYARFAGTSVFLSIMAGRTIAGMRAVLGEDAAVVRAMPNLPAAIRRGVSIACAGPGVKDADRALCDALLRAIGTVGWVEDEGLMDAVTAVSGSGPAYVFLLAELMEAAARAQGLPPDLARLVARETVAGAGALLAASGEDAAALRQAVTSPGGTTAAALAVLMAEHGLPKLVSEAIDAAVRRSRELAG